MKSWKGAGTWTCGVCSASGYGDRAGWIEHYRTNHYTEVKR